MESCHMYFVWRLSFNRIPLRFCCVVSASEVHSSLRLFHCLHMSYLFLMDSWVVFTSLVITDIFIQFFLGWEGNLQHWMWRLEKVSSVLNKLSQRDLWDIQVVRSRASEVQPEAQEREDWGTFSEMWNYSHGKILGWRVKCETRWERNPEDYGYLKRGILQEAERNMAIYLCASITRLRTSCTSSQFATFSRMGAEYMVIDGPYRRA